MSCSGNKFIPETSDLLPSFIFGYERKAMFAYLACFFCFEMQILEPSTTGIAVGATLTEKTQTGIPAQSQCIFLSQMTGH